MDSFAQNDFAESEKAKHEKKLYILKIEVDSSLQNGHHKVDILDLKIVTLLLILPL